MFAGVVCRAVGVTGPIDPPGVGLGVGAFYCALFVCFIVEHGGVDATLELDEGVAGLDASPIEVASEGEAPLRGSRHCGAGSYTGLGSVVPVVLPGGEEIRAFVHAIVGSVAGGVGVVPALELAEAWAGRGGVHLLVDVVAGDALGGCWAHAGLAVRLGTEVLDEHVLANAPECGCGGEGDGD